MRKPSAIISQEDLQLGRAGNSGHLLSSLRKFLKDNDRFLFQTVSDEEAKGNKEADYNEKAKAGEEVKGNEEAKGDEEADGNETTGDNQKAGNVGGWRIK